MLAKTRVLKRLFAGFVLTGIFSVIIWIFWYQGIQYLLPTPVPENYQVVLPDEVIRYDTGLIPQQYSRPKLLHFFNPHCPCSRFNVKHFQSLEKEYSKEVDFFVVVISREKIEAARRLIGDDIKILVDDGERLAKACGVYSTPQAALIQKDNRLYYRGNYNRSRYCTDKNSNYVQMALDSLMEMKHSPQFSELATRSYGCSIDDDRKPNLGLQ
jgi:hypothetical protein